MLRALSYISFFILFQQQVVLSQDIVISKDFGSTLVGTYSYLYEDKEGEKTLEDVLNIPDTEWEKYNRPHILKGLFYSNFWIKFNLKNVTSTE